MFALSRGLGMKKMAILFCIFTALAAFGIGNTVQANAISTLLYESYAIDTWISGLAIASLVAAVGLSPIYELVSNAASPVKLIALSQPGQHLLKRLFLEASGTHSHSMMVANLADSAAEAIGADAWRTDEGSFLSYGCGHLAAE